MLFVNWTIACKSNLSVIILGKYVLVSSGQNQFGRSLAIHHGAAILVSSSKYVVQEFCIWFVLWGSLCCPTVPSNQITEEKLQVHFVKSQIIIIKKCTYYVWLMYLTIMVNFFLLFATKAGLVFFASRPYPELVNLWDWQDLWLDFFYKLMPFLNLTIKKLHTGHPGITDHISWKPWGCRSQITKQHC